MGRTSQIDEAELFGVIANIMQKDGTLSMQSIVSETGISTGSLYHRFQSREAMLAEAWVDALGAFQIAFIDAMNAGPDTGEEAALVTPRYCREFHDRALILACCQRSQFIGQDMVSEKLNACAKRNTEMSKLLKAYARETSTPLDACYLGIVHYPLAVVRHYLPNRKVPKSADSHVRAAFHAAMSTKNV